MNTHSLSQTLPLSLADTLALTLKHTLTLTHTLTHTHIQTHSESHSHSHSHSHSQTHTHTHTLKLTHRRSHSHIHIHTHTQMRTHSHQATKNISLHTYTLIISNNETTSISFFKDNSTPNGTLYINPCPGLVIDQYGDNNSIASAQRVEFYLNSHVAIQGK